MTYKLNISLEDNLATMTVKGTCSIIDMKALVNILLQDALYIPTLNLFIDKREVKYTPVVSEVLDISQFITQHKQHFRGKIAIIMDSELFHIMFKLSSQYTSKHGLNSNVFHNPNEALAWIAEPDTIKVH